jgi:hypothetical protein
MDDAGAKPKPDPTAADLLIESLIDWGIDKVFGLLSAECRDRPRCRAPRRR